MILLSGYIIAGWKWGDWKNWTKYYPTILYFIIGDLLYNFLLYNYPMWMYHTSFDQAILRNQTLISLAVEFVSFPVKVLIYLGHYPEKESKVHQLLYISKWVIFFSVFELFALKFLGLISHHNGWNMIYTTLFYIVIFTVLRLHYVRPLFTWMVSLGITVFLLVYFHVPIGTWK